MCLSEVYSDEDMNKIVEGLPEVAPGVVEVWKVTAVETTINGSQYRPIYDYKEHRYSFPFSIAQSRINSTYWGCKYWTGYHFFISKDDALAYLDSPHGKEHPVARCIKCFVLKEWITTIGKDCRLNKNGVLVASQAFFPTYPETEAKLEDFLEWQRENEPVEELAVKE
jgi:hypothetical protein